MRKRHFLVFALCCVALGTARAQDVLFYKFDEVGGTKVVNYASGSGLAPAEGTLTGTLATKFQPGRFGPSCLGGGTATSSAGSTFVATGYQNSMTNASFTVAFAMKQRTAPSITSYFFQSNGGFRMFTGGVASRGLSCREWNKAGGMPLDLVLSTDVQTLAATAWLHVALVVDATSLTATWYLDGVAQTPITISAGATNTTAGLFTACGFAASYGGLYDIDDFRFSLRAASAAEIQAWKGASPAADGPYGKGCNGGTLKSSGGAPKLGNALYSLDVGGNAGLYALAIGTNRLSFASIPLPLDLGTILPTLAGCNWESSGEVFINGAITGTSASVLLPIPANPSFEGIPLWSQALIVGPSGEQSTNAFALSLGN